MLDAQRLPQFRWYPDGRSAAHESVFFQIVCTQSLQFDLRHDYVIIG